MRARANVVYTTETPYSVLTRNFITRHLSPDNNETQLLLIDNKWRSIGKKVVKHDLIGLKYV